MADRIQIEVCWIGQVPVVRIPLSLPAGATVACALQASGVARSIGPGGLDGLGLAVFGRRCAADRVLDDGDRVEVLPPLTVDPKTARQRRADHKRRATGDVRWLPGRSAR